MSTFADENKWLQMLQSFLNEVLKPIIKDQKDRNQYLDKDAMIVWARAFTHETVPADNYEDLEFLGDAILKAVFPKYLMKRLPHLHKGEYTELNVAYMSKIMQAKLARKLRLGEYIRLIGLDRAILNLETDVFESFFGALDTISDSIFPGLGFANCYNMILHIFSDEEIDENKGTGSAKTQVLQMFVRFDLPKPEAIVDDSNKHEVKFTVKLLNEHLEFLQSYGVDIPNPNIGFGIAGTKKEAEFEAYTDAFKTLGTYGITTEWAAEAKQVRDFSDPSVAQFVPAASARLKREGYTTMYFYIPRKTVTPKGAIVQLRGIKEDGREGLLSYTYSPDRENSYRTAKTLVVQQYATGSPTIQIT